MRIGIDGYNLAIREGTGVATYSATVANVLKQAGHEIVGVYGLDPGSQHQMREMLFFDRLGNGHGLNALEMARRISTSVTFNHFARRLREVPLTGMVDTRSFGFRLPDFNELWSLGLLYDIASARFKVLRQFVTVTMPNPPDVMLWTYPVPVRMRGAKNVYTIHDLVPIKLPHTTLDDKAYYRQLIARCLKTSDHIATVSENSRNDILSLFDVDPQKVSNTYQSTNVPPEVASSTVEEDCAVINSMFGLPAKGFYLFFGALDPKKNIGRIIDGYLNSQSRRPLVIVSSRDWGMDWETRMLGKNGRVYGRKLDKRIIQLQYLPRPTLFRLIRASRAVVFPSLYEGFGLPVLEALQAGTAVITSETSSIPEVVGDAGIKVNPYKTQEIAEAIRKLDADDELVDRMSAAGLQQGAKFTDAIFGKRLGEMFTRMGLG